jgi:hypothetical protein
MWMPIGVAAGVILIAGTSVWRWLRRPDRDLNLGLVSTSWLADQKMGKHDPGWP